MRLILKLYRFWGDYLSDEREKSLELIYDEVLHQYQGAFRSFQTMRERTGQIMGFIGIILNLEILALLQIVYSKINVQYELILVISLFFLVLSLFVATLAYRQVPFQNLSTKICLQEKFISKSKEELLEIITRDRLKDIEENKKQIHKRASCVHVSLYNFTISIFLAAMFFIMNFTGLKNIMIAVLFSILITLVLYLITSHRFSRKLKIN
jgi:uncharacterized membrane protein